MIRYKSERAVENMVSRRAEDYDIDLDERFRPAKVAAGFEKPEVCVSSILRNYSWNDEKISELLKQCVDIAHDCPPDRFVATFAGYEPPDIKPDINEYVFATGAALYRYAAMGDFEEARRMKDGKQTDNH